MACCEGCAKGRGVSPQQQQLAYLADDSTCCCMHAKVSSSSHKVGSRPLTHRLNQQTNATGRTRRMERERDQERSKDQSARVEPAYQETDIHNPRSRRATYYSSGESLCASKARKEWLNRNHRSINSSIDKETDRSMAPETHQSTRTGGVLLLEDARHGAVWQAVLAPRALFGRVMHAMASTFLPVGYPNVSGRGAMRGHSWVPTMRRLPATFLAQLSPAPFHHPI